VVQLPSKVIKSPVSASFRTTLPEAEREKTKGYVVVNALTFSADDTD